MAGLLLLKPEALEVERIAILAYGAHYLVRSPRGDSDLNVQRDLDIRAHQGRQMLNHFLCDTSAVAIEAQGINCHSAVEPARLIASGGI